MSRSDGKDHSQNGGSDKELKDNAKKEHKPKDLGREDHAPVGSVGLKPGNTGIVFTGSQKNQVIQDHQSEKKEKKNFSKENDLSDRVNPKDENEQRSPTRKEQGPLSQEFNRAADDKDRGR